MHRLHTTHELCAFAIFTVVLLATVQSAIATGHSFEKCEIQGDCASGYSCYEYREDKRAFVFCIDADNLGNICYCLPFATTSKPISCNESADCTSPYEVCAKDTQSQYCTSCNALIEGRSNFHLTLVDENDTKCRSVPTVTPSPSPPPTLVRAYKDDYCTPERSECDVCQDRFELQCSVTDVWCVCNPDPDKETCQSSEDCPANTACVSKVRTGVQQCVSCTRVAQEVGLKPLDAEGTACKMIPPPRAVDMPLGPNGFTFDACSMKTQCQLGRTCRTASLINEDAEDCDFTYKYAAESCLCMPGKYKECDKSSDCVVGEACTAYPGELRPLCISASILRAHGSHYLPVIGDEPVFPTATSSVNLTFEACKYDWDCKSPRRCKHVEEMHSFGGCAGRNACECEPLYLEPCNDSGDCDEGESCAIVVGSKMGSFCAANTIIAVDWTLSAVGDDNETDGASDESQGVTNQPDQKGLTGDRCLQNDDCDAPRICRHVTEAGELECGGRPGCTCAYINDDGGICEKDAECSLGETCMFVKDDVSTVNATCVSAWAIANDRRSRYIDVETALAAAGSPTAEPTDDESKEDKPSVCIDADLMAHLPQSEHVFAAMRQGVVLCDGSRSCATPGHVVVWRGAAMMMRTYCEQVGECHRDVIAVNSPRMRRGMRVPSRTDGLEFTAFAARFETKMEEHVLKTLVHVGL